MKEVITSEEARTLVKKYLKKDYVLAHSRETEVVMRALAAHFGEDAEFWGNCGLLHDLDLDIIGEQLATHGYKTIEILKSEGYEIPLLFKAVLSHAENLGYVTEKRESRLDFALAAAENITGIIIAYALIRPDRKLAGVEPKSILKRLKEKTFAAKVNRDYINDIEKTGLTKENFIEIAVNAMKAIASEVGL